MDCVQRWGGEISYIIPYTGTYEISISGSQGSAYSDNSGGYGCTLNKTIRLQYGDVLKITTPYKPTGYTTENGVLTIPSGTDVHLYCNGTDVLNASGGNGFVNNIIAPNGITSVKARGANYSVHWHSGNGLSGATHANQFPTLYQTANPGGCYGASGHTHNATGECTWHYNSHKHTDGCSSKSFTWSGGPSCPNCGKTGIADTGEHLGNENEGSWNGDGFDAVWHCSHDCKTWSCRDMPLNDGCAWDCGDYVNTWTLKCGHQQGEILNVYNSQTNLVSAGWGGGDAWRYDSKSFTNTGNAKFTIKLVEQDLLFYKDVPVSIPYYMDTKCNLVIRDNIVTYFKRD